MPDVEPPKPKRPRTHTLPLRTAVATNPSRHPFRTMRQIIHRVYFRTASCPAGICQVPGGCETASEVTGIFCLPFASGKPWTLLLLLCRRRVLSAGGGFLVIVIRIRVPEGGAVEKCYEYGLAEDAT
ncbi:hypothetical protein KC333_g29 [Hortaea werneckii]|nr:hypothetical protein KC333_g29 [Hortaea werneckii]